MKCANCDKDAIWIFDDRGAANQFFCDADLPWFLKNRAKTGSLKKVNVAAAPQVVEEKPAEAPKKKTKKKANVKNSTDTDEAGAPGTEDSSLPEGTVSL